MASSTTTDSGWTRRFRAAPQARARLICFPHAGGSATSCFPFAQALTPGTDVLAVQYPGRQERRSEPPLDSIELLADALTRELLPCADRPLVFFGHSMGAIIAYETALRFEAAGVPVAHLVASGRRAPSRYRPETVHLRGDEGILTELRVLRGTDSALLDDPEMQALILPALRTDYRAIETYRHAPDLRLERTPVTALTGDADPRTTIDEARSWSAHTAAAFDLRVLPGDHFFALSRPEAVVPVLAGLLAGLG
jgi:pyochelin biosynthesis protein PchC